MARTAFRGVMRRLCRLAPRDAAAKDVLFLCHNGVMADYLAPVLRAIEGDPRLRCRVTFPDDPRTRHERGRVLEALPVPEVALRWAHVLPWDLIITADHGHAELADRRQCPVIYTGHGITGKVVAGEDGDYSYGPRTRLADGSPRYSCMFEASQANRRRVVAEYPLLGGAIEVVGSLKDDELLTRLPERDRIRAELGYDKSDVVVFVLASWGAQSLFHVLGDPLIEEARRLSDRFRFTLSVHPHEYRPRSDGGRVWGDYLGGLTQEGFRVREPGDDWVPHMVACDVLLTDHTSLCVYGALAGKPMVWSPVPDEFIQEGTALWRLREMSPVLADATRLEGSLQQGLHSYPMQQLAELSHEINSRPGEARELVRAVVYRLLSLEPYSSSSSRTVAANPPSLS